MDMDILIVEFRAEIKQKKKQKTKNKEAKENGGFGDDVLCCLRKRQDKEKM